MLAVIIALLGFSSCDDTCEIINETNTIEKSLKILCEELKLLTIYTHSLYPEHGNFLEYIINQ